MKKDAVTSLVVLIGIFVLSLSVQDVVGESVPWSAIWLEMTTGSEPLARTTHSAVWDSCSNQVIVFGGITYDSQGNTIGLRDVWRFDPVSSSWSQGSDAPMTRGAHVAVWDAVNCQMIVHGGESYYGSYDYYQDTWVYNPTADTWTRKADGPTVRAWAPGIWDPVHDQVIMYGGYYRPINDGLDDTWVYVPSADAWIRKADGPSGRWAHMAVWNSKDNVMIVFGGVSQSGWLTDTWAYDPEQDQWYQRAPIPYPLAQASAVYDPIHNVVVAFGGETLQDHSNVPTGKTWIYDPTTDTWTVPEIAIQPSARGWLQAVHVWDSVNSQMILFGGSGTGIVFNDLWVFQIVSWEHVFQDVCRNTMLKISTDDKYFQFVAPDRDFGVRYDPKMRIISRIIFISYGDKEVQLIAAAADDKIRFCTAFAYDKQTRKTYWLIERAKWQR